MAGSAAPGSGTQLPRAAAGPEAAQGRTQTVAPISPAASVPAAPDEGAPAETGPVQGTAADGGYTGGYTVYYDGTGPLEIRIDIPIENYLDLYFDNERWVRDVDYAVRSGSTILTVSETRLSAVAEGSHIIRAEFLNASVDIPFTLDKAAAPLSPLPAPVPSVPAAAGPAGGDKPVIPMILAAIAALGAAAAALALKAFRSGAAKF
jgi:hypothetical protein